MHILERLRCFEMCTDVKYAVFANLSPLRIVVSSKFVSFPPEWFCFAFVENFCLNRGHKDSCKGNCHLSAHCGSMSLEIVSPIKMKGVFL